MAEGFEPYHVPQQSRRDKLRVGCVESLQGCAGLLPFYDPSLLPSDLLTCANLHHQNNHHHHHHPLSESTCKSNPSSSNRCEVVKEEGVNLMGYVGGILSTSSSSSTPHPHHLYMDPQSSLQINPSSIQEMNSNNPFLYSPQNFRIFDQSFNGGDVVVFKPEPLSMAHHDQANNTNGQALSLSLSSHHNHNNLPLELNLQRYDQSSSFSHDKVVVSGGGGYVVPGIVGGSGGGSTSNDVSRSSVPLGPFTGYASILKGSRFLKPAQQLLEELCDVGRGIYATEKITPDSSLMDPSTRSFGETATIDDSISSSGDGGEHRRKKSRLISMLDEVYRRYKHYYQQMQAVVASFESVPGLSNAAPFANLALKAMSKHFKCLKNAITDQLQMATKDHDHLGYRKDETPRFGNSDRGLYSPRPIHKPGFLEHQPVWRPQRGLPERAVTVLRAWLFEHFLHPYPTDTDKLMLANQTGLSRSQVSNWFINARVRLWKPMVEEIHMLETRQAQKASQREEQSNERPNDHLPTADLHASENTSTQRAADISSKRTRNDIPEISMGNDEPIMNLSYNNLSRHPHVGLGMSTAGGSGGVSLTLGLHQNNNGVGLPEPFPINAARRFGLEANSEGYVMSFEAQNRQFGRDIMGGQLLHDFVG
ncbi:BEL1-like homeodomain protein 9 [Cornus florida]|uniref:BEL1-like homeodomain protein 9 n=1 Tax=Cornus florida TaxID=4283 RepID=UPI0028A0CCE5|nr:BEL1-like homeodomain protein 9 [Cornus florida]